MEDIIEVDESATIVDWQQQYNTLWQEHKQLEQDLAWERERYAALGEIDEMIEQLGKEKEQLAVKAHELALMCRESSNSRNLILQA
jgi:hypothetical protein